jgi:hypothetical protein
MSAPDDLGDLRGQVNDQLVDNLLAPVGGPAAAVAGSPDAAAMAAQPDDGSFQVALGPVERAAIRAGMAATGADKRLDSAVGRMTGGAFSPDQVHTLEDRALVNAQDPDKGPLMRLQDGSPIVVNPQQKAIIDRLMSQSGTDQLGRAAQAAYQRAWQNGQIKLHGN